MAPRSDKKEFRTSVILTEPQYKRVVEIAEANDASIAWVLRQALDRYLEAQGRAIGEAPGGSRPSSTSDTEEGRE